VWAVGLHEGINPMDVRATMLQHGAIARPIAPSTLAFCPPLVIDDADLDLLLAALDAALAKAGC
jgi:adenosylmethionine-8-amino-7-oxononanoate aminotransferase